MLVAYNVKAGFNDIKVNAQHLRELRGEDTTPLFNCESDEAV